MRGMVSIATVLALTAVPSFAQAPREFPVGATYKVISISGFDVQNKNLTLTFGTTWRWPISAAASQEAQTKWGNPQ